MTKSYTDPEFGEITVSFRAGARVIRISVNTDGRLKATAPKHTPMLAIKTMVAAQREQIRVLFSKHITPAAYTHGQQIGKSHHLVIVPAAVASPTIRTQGQNIIVRVPHTHDPSGTEVQRLIRDAVIKALRTEAKAHLPRRLEHLAAHNGYTYKRVRFSHAGTRWGSCSTTGTISLNIALMKLPDELIDYVLAHELSHTKFMDHSTAFWAELSKMDPHYRLHKRQMQLHTPTI